jgi:hypothetical protein
MTIQRQKKSIRTTANPRSAPARRIDELDQEEGNGTAAGQKLTELRGKCARLHKEVERRDMLIDHVLGLLKSDKASAALEALEAFRP